MAAAVTVAMAGPEVAAGAAATLLTAVPCVGWGLWHVVVGAGGAAAACLLVVVSGTVLWGPGICLCWC